MLPAQEGLVLARRSEASPPPSSGNFDSTTFLVRRTIYFTCANNPWIQHVITATPKMVGLLPCVILCLPAPRCYFFT